MPASIDKLRKFFRLEAENGYNNSAVIGGLAKILDYWENEARAESVPEELVQAIADRLRGYESLPPQGRGDSLKGIWKRIQAQYPELAEKRPQRPVILPSEQTPPEPPPAMDAPLPPAPGPAKDARPARSAPPRSASYPGAQTSQTPAALNADLTVLQGVGPKNAQSLTKLGMHTLGDMLYNFPRRYDDYSQLKPINRLWYGEEVTVLGVIQSVSARPIKGGKFQIMEVVINDGTGALRLTWFNQPWLANRFKEEMPIAVSGKVEQYLGRLVMNNPDWEPIETESLHTRRIVPVYSLTASITQKWLRGQMSQVVNFWAPRVPDPLPASIRQSADLYELGEALAQAHFPESQNHLRAARERLAFDEVFYLQMGVLRQKRDWQTASARTFEIETEWFDAQKSALPFPLTGAQTRVLEDIRHDLTRGHPMNRLIQGDVGSGKTVVAALTAAMINKHGAQAAILAPTSILAEQHYRSFVKLLAREDGEIRPEHIRLLIGDTGAGERAEIFEQLASGAVKILIGTHAILEDPVVFADLQLAVIDEQHRFGVEQRATLRSKGNNPHLLVMTATPIPRSLALTIYGDLDLSVMDEMPPGRQAIETFLLTPTERERAYSLIRGQIKAGRQAFVIYPLVEESEKSEKPAAVEEHARLQNEIFPDLKLGLLHGRMKPAEKDEVMTRFRNGEFHILVSTTVIEVGVDVPNSTVMLIEGANHFGLAQLHQLRGRVGRGSEQSYCLLIPDKADAVENERLKAMVESNDGFVLAERDLEQRGPGDFLGTRQAGYESTLKMASLTDVHLIEKARNHAQRLFEQDPDLSAPEHALLAESVARFWGGGKGDVS